MKMDVLLSYCRRSWSQHEPILYCIIGTNVVNVDVISCGHRSHVARYPIILRKYSKRHRFCTKGIVQSVHGIPL